MGNFQKNREKLEGLLEENSAALVFAGQAPYKRGDEQYPFSPDRNFYYVTGIERENCIFFTAKTTSGVTTTLYIPRDNGILAKWVGANITTEEARQESGIENIEFIDSFRTDFAAFLFKHNIKTVYLDLENRDWNALPSTALSFANELGERFPGLNLQDLYPIFSDLRLIKEEWELERMRKAMHITEEGFYAMMENARGGMMEYEIEAYFDFTLTKNGVRQKAFQTIAAAGKRGTILHYVENNQPTKDGDLILVDAGAQVGWYNGDITRTFPVSGKFTDRQKEVYNIVLAGQKKVIETIRPGVPFTRLNELLKEHYLEELKKLGLVETMEDVSKYYYHGVSHYLGAETHDIGRYMDRDLQAGMVLTVEPGLYIDEWDIGIRIEDDVLVTAEGCEVMTQNMIRTVEEIEGFMAKGREA
ncbi:aminopeptidase P family protein [Anaerotignum sp. MB30-C6]|uniref:aminopeptidase P family protein n=1 Tax=Anaerotignum sp. MB30-C6 TaxID=3070814 RepID=UPI0027DAB6D4|nr:aminopeptidase P family protein [Anaerotignum sp. MB30-C6]WMI81631.1 aminopeptidase P family protein [Anaerotignum sp. MB30-C6]